MSFFYNYIKKNNISILYLLLSVWCITLIYDWTLYSRMYPDLAHFVNRVSKVIRTLFVIYFICNLDYKKKFFNKLLLAVIFVVFCFISNKYTKNWYIFDIFFVPLFLSTLINRDRLVKLLLVTFFVAVSSILFLHFLDLLPLLTFDRAGKIRYALGFMHPNTLGFIVVFMCILYVIKNKVIDVTGYIILFLCALFCIIVPRSNTSSFLIILLMLFSTVANYLNKANLNNVQKSKLFYLCCAFVFTVIIVTYLIAYFEIGREFIEKLPGALWARFDMGKRALDNYGLSVLGQPIKIVCDYEVQVLGQDGYYTVDCAYFYVPITFGVVCFCLYLAVFIYSIRNTIYNSHYEILSVLILMILYGISEVVIFTPLFMFVFLCSFIRERR